MTWTAMPVKCSAGRARCKWTENGRPVATIGLQMQRLQRISHVHDADRLRLSEIANHTIARESDGQRSDLVSASARIFPTVYEKQGTKRVTVTVPCCGFTRAANNR